MRQDSNTGDGSRQRRGDNNVAKSFAELLGSEELAASIASKGLVEPNKVQQRGVTALMNGRDVVLKAPRGSGRTTAYGLVTLSKAASTAGTKLVVMASDDSRLESAKAALSSLGLSVATLGSGENASGADSILGTPQTILDAIADNVFDATSLPMFVIEGIDKMLLSASGDDLGPILSSLSKNTQIIVVAENMTGKILSFIKKFLKSPETVEVTGGGMNQENRAGRQQQGSEESRGAPEADKPEEVVPAPVVAGTLCKPEEAAHIYLDAGADVLGKPMLLCDIVEANGMKPTIVYCAMPSDTDLVKALLRKRGIQSKKLIGNIPAGSVYRMAEEMKRGEFSVLIATDIGGKHFDGGLCDFVINYGVPKDGENYLKRQGTARKETTVISLISPLDIANFHFLKKALTFEIAKGEAPTVQAVTAAKVGRWADMAAASPAQKDERAKELLGIIMGRPDKDAILQMMVFNTLEGISTAAREERESEGEERGHGRNRRDRDGRDGGGRFNKRDHDRRDGGSREDSDSFEHLIPPKRDVRFYVGHGSEQGMNEQAMKGLAAKFPELGNEVVKRYRGRNKFAYVDVAEESADVFERTLSEASFGDGKLFIKRAVTISEARENAPAKDESSADMAAASAAHAEADSSAMAVEG